MNFGEPAMKLMPQLAFNGQCREAFERYASILGGTITVMNAFAGPGDADMPEGCTPPSPGQIRFAELRVGDWALLGNDVPAESYKALQGFSIALHAESVAEARRIFSALAEGAGSPSRWLRWSGRRASGWSPTGSVFRG